MEHLLEVKNLSVSIEGSFRRSTGSEGRLFFVKKGRSAGYSWRIRMWKECALQKYHEAFATKCKDQRGKYPCEWTGYHLLSGEGDAEASWKGFFHDFSGSYDILESNDQNWKTDRRSSGDPQ